MKHALKSGAMGEGLHGFTMVLPWFYHHGFTSVYSTPSSNQTAPLENPHWRILGGDIPADHV